MLGFRLVHRMILWELVKVFLLSWTALTSLLLLAGLVAEATQHGLGPGQIMSAIPLLLPNMLPYTLPTTTLFATCIVYGRLAADNEILAIKTAGVHIGHVVWPAILLGLVASTATGALYVDVIPSTHYQLRTQVFANMEEYLYGILRKEGRLQHPKLNYTIYVHHVEGEYLRDALFMRRDPKTGLYDIIAKADKAKLSVDLEKKLINVLMYKCFIVSAGQDTGQVDEKEWPVELPPEFVSMEKFRATDMTWTELSDYRTKLQEDLDRINAQIATVRSQYNQARPPALVIQHLANLNMERKRLLLTVASVDTEKQMRPSLALGCLCFVLVGCPVGIWFSKSDYLSAFITCFLPIIVLYYPLMLSGINLAKGRQLAPLFALWGANLLMLVIAVALFRRLARN